MIKYNGLGLLLVFMVLGITSTAQVENENIRALFYRKKELNSGVRLAVNREREELISDFSRRYKEQTYESLTYNFNSKFWNFLDYKQDEFKINLDLGPYAAAGDWLYHSDDEEIEADHNLYGIRANLGIDYIQRYYVTKNNYTIVNLSGWSNLRYFRQNSDGSIIDSLGVVSDYDVTDNDSKFRYGFNARAGWGFGRLNAMNNFMLAHFITEKYYAGRIFSEKEIRDIAEEVFLIKQERNIVAGHNVETEAQLIADYLNEKLMLSAPDNLMMDWELGEFKPRLHGQRVEIGPFFKYFNREPDFIYGGYITYENNKYSNFNWNRNIRLTLNYNRYKRKDWANAEIDMGWSYFPDLKRQLDFGVRYVPGIELNDFRDIREFTHGLIPYIAYYTQLNAKSRIDLSLAYRISGSEKIMLPGPEFSLSFYRSRY